MWKVSRHRCRVHTIISSCWGEVEEIFEKFRKKSNFTRVEWFYSCNLIYSFLLEKNMWACDEAWVWRGREEVNFLRCFPHIYEIKNLSGFLSNIDILQLLMQWCCCRAGDGAGKVEKFDVILRDLENLFCHLSSFNSLSIFFSFLFTFTCTQPPRSRLIHASKLNQSGILSHAEVTRMLSNVPFALSFHSKIYGMHSNFIRLSRF